MAKSDDERVIAQLKKAGSKLDQPHDVEFFFFLPDEGAADRVAKRLFAAGFDVETEETDDGTWSLVANGSMIPIAAEMTKLRTAFDALAAAEGGSYDGWGASVVE